MKQQHQTGVPCETAGRRHDLRECIDIGPFMSKAEALFYCGGTTNDGWILRKPLGMKVDL